VQSTRAGPLRVEGQPDKKEIGGTTIFWQCWGLDFGLPSLTSTPAQQPKASRNLSLWSFLDGYFTIENENQKMKITG
jgi:hypothetical protein